MAEAPLREAAEDEQHDQGDHEEHHGLSRGSGEVARADPLVDEARHDLGLEGDEAREEDKRAELADRPRERKRGAGEDRRQEAGQDDTAEGREWARTKG